MLLCRILLGYVAFIGVDVERVSAYHKEQKTDSSVELTWSYRPTFTAL